MGAGATVGSVIPTVGAIVPAAVGVDIGCGMCAVRTDLVAGDLPDSLAGVRREIERAVPVGRASHRKLPRPAERAWYAGLKTRYEAIEAKHPAVAEKTSAAGFRFSKKLVQRVDDGIAETLTSAEKLIGGAVRSARETTKAATDLAQAATHGLAGERPAAASA